MLMALVLEPKMEVQELVQERREFKNLSVQELQFKNFISSKTTVQELPSVQELLFKNHNSRTSSVQEQQFKNYAGS